MSNIINRLHRNAIKQKEYRHIVRGRSGVSKAVVKRQADIYFLHKYAKLSLRKLGSMYHVSYQMIDQLLKRSNTMKFDFTICHPNRSCM